MNILYVIDSLNPGGAERQLVELIKGLDSDRYVIHLVCLNHTPVGYTDIVESLNIKRYYFCRRFRYDIRPVLEISRLIKEKEISLVHSFMNLGSVMGVLAAKLTGRPVVCSAIRDAKDHSFKVKISKRILARTADILVANSWAGFTSRFSSIKAHFRVVYNGLDFSRFRQQKTDVVKLRNELCLSKFKHIVGMVASLSHHKDHETLLNAAPIVLQNCPHTCFVLVGDGSERESLEQKVGRMGLDKNVLFLGHRKDIDQIYYILNIFVLLTNYDVHLEGISNAITEAMAVGVPVIASKGGGTDEIIKNGANGILVEPKSPQTTAEAIVDLLIDRTKAERLANNAMISIRKSFNLQRYASEYETIYRNLIQNEN